MARGNTAWVCACAVAMVATACGLAGEGVDTAGAAPAGDGSTQQQGDGATSGDDAGNGAESGGDAPLDCEQTGGANVCSPPVPDGNGGWSLVDVEIATGEATPPACPAGFGPDVVVNEGPHSSAATCGCTCTGNPCLTGGQSQIVWRTGTSNCNDGTQNVTLDGVCHGFSAMASGGTIHGAAFAPGDPAPKPCTDVPTKPSITADATVRVCSAPSSASGDGCAPGSACVPKPASGSICWRHDGDVACADAGMVRHLVGSLGAVNDTRACAACGCSTPTCSNRTVGLFSDAMCATKVVDIPNTNNLTTCPDLSGGAPENASFYKYLATAACAAGNPTPPVSGAVTFQSPVTLCCAP